MDKGRLATPRYSECAKPIFEEGVVPETKVCSSAAYAGFPQRIYPPPPPVLMLLDSLGLKWVCRESQSLMATLWLLCFPRIRSSWRDPVSASTTRSFVVTTDVTQAIWGPSGVGQHATDTPVCNISRQILNNLALSYPLRERWRIRCESVQGP